MKTFLLIIFILILIAGGIFLYLYFSFYSTGNPGVIASDSQSTKLEKIDNWLTNLEKEDKFNGGVLLVKDGKAIFNKTYGYTDYHLNEKLTSDSSIRLASVSKQFTAMGVMLLQKNGKLDYDDFVSQYIPGFQYSDITIRHLLNQTSGIPDVYFDLAQKHKESLDGPLSIQKAIELFINSDTKQKFKVNDRFMYSNTNYILLAGIVENVTGKSFEAYMQENLFTPAGMINTRVWNLLSKDVNFPNQTHSFYKQGGEAIELKPEFVDGVAGDGAVFSSLNDLVIWDTFLYSNSLISQDEIQEAFLQPTLNNGKKSPYGFGWMLEGDVVRHNGGWLGTKSILIRNTKQKTMLGVITNAGNWQVFSINNELKKIFGKQIEKL